MNLIKRGNQFINADTGEIVSGALIDTALLAQGTAGELANAQAKLAQLNEDIEVLIASHFPDYAPLKARIAELEGSYSNALVLLRELALNEYQVGNGKSFLGGAVTIRETTSEVINEESALEFALENGWNDALSLKKAPFKKLFGKLTAPPEGIVTEVTSATTAVTESKLTSITVQGDE